MNLVDTILANKINKVLDEIEDARSEHEFNLRNKSSD
jgi:hypothetical protein